MVFNRGCSKQRGAQTVVVVGTRDSRLEIAQRFGADQTVNLRDVDWKPKFVESSSGADVVIETAGQASAQEMSLLVRRGGIVVGRVWLMCPSPFIKTKICYSTRSMSGSFLRPADLN